jgi:hypothetical protein
MAHYGERNAGAVLVACVLLAPGALAQGKRAVEVHAGFGTSFGFLDVTDAIRTGFQIGVGSSARVTMQQGSSFKWLAGGGFAVPLTERLYATFDLNYNRIANPTLTATLPGRSPVSANFTVNLLDFSGGVQYHLAGTGTRLRPYVAGGLGALRTSVTGSGATLPAALTESVNDFSINGGGGIRIYAGKRWGFQPDARVVRIPDVTFGRASIAVFYEFGGGR